jgi:hypothetical protein
MTDRMKQRSKRGLHEWAYGHDIGCSDLDNGVVEFVEIDDDKLCG